VDVQLGQAGKIAGQLVRLAGSPVGDHQLRRPLLGNRQNRSPGGAARAANEHPFACQGLAQVALNVIDQADAVEIVGPDAIVLKLQGIRGARLASAIKGIGGQFICLQLERQRDIHPQPTLRAERLHSGREAVQRRFDGGVGDVLACCGREQTVDQGRLAVGDGVAKNGVAVGHEIGIFGT
jgi:hypothetical protein